MFYVIYNIIIHRKQKLVVEENVTTEECRKRKLSSEGLNEDIIDDLSEELSRERESNDESREEFILDEDDIERMKRDLFLFALEIVLATGISTNISCLYLFFYILILVIIYFVQLIYI